MIKGYSKDWRIQSLEACYFQREVYLKLSVDFRPEPLGL